MAGYSGTPLPKKLGITDSATVAVRAARGVAVPEDLGIVPAGRPPYDVLVGFVLMEAQLRSELPAWSEAIDVDGGLWIAWPKKAARKLDPAFVSSDMTEDVVRDVALPAGLVDNKVCAIDEHWSGLRVVWRKELRPGRRR